MAINETSKERIKFACKELEEALAMFGEEGETAAKAAAGARQEKISEIKRQLRSIREQLDHLSQ